jgi:hypothetical protein
MEPNVLAGELGITSSVLRRWLRATFTRSEVEHGAPWALTADQVAAARLRFGGTKAKAAEPAGAERRQSGGREVSDEAYVLDLCDELLGEPGLRQHRFEWLLGDPGAAGRSVKLPVDAYYPQNRLVLEYRERQHDEPVGHFDKPDKLTVSGVHRGEQRRLYDDRREELIPLHGLRLVIVRPSDLDATAAGRLRETRANDLDALRRILGV